MSHGHEHSHECSKTAEDHAKVSEPEKLVKMVKHWIHHNEEHARSYRDWAQRARDMGREEICLILEEVASGTELQNKHLERILVSWKDHPSSH